MGAALECFARPPRALLTHTCLSQKFLMTRGKSCRRRCGMTYKWSGHCVGSENSQPSICSNAQVVTVRVVVFQALLVFFIGTPLCPLPSPPFTRPSPAPGRDATQRSVRCSCRLVQSEPSRERPPGPYAACLWRDRALVCACF